MPRTPTVAFALLALAACSSPDTSPEPAPQPEPEPASAPPSASVPDLTGTAKAERAPDGTAIELLNADALSALMKEPSDKVRVYNFWATWCGPCVAELPMLRDLAASRDDFELVLVNVDIGPMRRARALPFIVDKQLGTIRNVGVDSRDPAKVLEQVIEGWNEAIPVTSVHRPDGQRATVFTRAVAEAELTAAIDAAR